MGLPKILCLHGLGQNEIIMAKKTKFIRDKLKDKVEFVYATGSYALPDDHPVVVGFNEYIKRNGLEDRKNQFDHFYTWFPLTDNFAADHIHTLSHTCKILKKQGPFVGVIGFSEGACLGTLLTKLLEIDHPMVSIANHPPLKLSIMFSGLINQMPEILKFFEIPVTTPSLHMYSKIDHVVKKEFSVENASCYINPIVVEHSLGHLIPSDPEYLSIILQFITKQLKLNPELQPVL